MKKRMNKEFKKIKDKTVEGISEFMKKILIFCELRKEKIEEIVEKVKNEKIDGPSLLTIFKNNQLSEKFDLSKSNATVLYDAIFNCDSDIYFDGVDGVNEFK